MRSKNYKAALLKAQMGGRLPKAQTLGEQPPPRPPRPTISGCMDPSAINYDPRVTPATACRNCCQYEQERAGVPTDKWTNCEPPVEGCPPSTIWNGPACQCVPMPGTVPDQTFFKTGGQYSPNMNKALKSFKKGGSTKK